jgi:hypothetical protein
MVIRPFEDLDGTVMSACLYAAEILRDRSRLRGTLLGQHAVRPSGVATDPDLRGDDKR